jgi:hypothetical protein
MELLCSQDSITATSKSRASLSPVATVVTLLELAVADMDTVLLGPTCKRFVAGEQRWDFLELLNVIQELARANSSRAETMP